MNYKSLLIVLFIFLLSCEQNNLNKDILNQEIMTRYKNSGFALVYDPLLKKEKKFQKKLMKDLFISFIKILKKILLLK